MRLWISILLLLCLCVACETEKPKTTSNLAPQNKPEIIGYTPNFEKSKKKVIKVNTYSQEFAEAVKTLNDALLTISVSDDAEKLTTILDNVVTKTDLAVKKEKDETLNNLLMAARHSLAEANFLIRLKLNRELLQDQEMQNILEGIIRKHELANIPEYERPGKVLLIAKIYIKSLEEIYHKSFITKETDAEPNTPIPRFTPITNTPIPSPTPIYNFPTPAPSPRFTKKHPIGATALCRDGTYSFSQNRRGTCSHHGGVAQWLY